MAWRSAGTRCCCPISPSASGPAAGGAYTAYVTGGTYANLEDTAELTAILEDCLEQNQPEGTVKDYRLRYLRQERGLYWRLAFVDMSMEQAMLREMMRSYLNIAAAAFLLLLGVSIILARWATRPVERAWRQQRQFLSDASHELKTPLAILSADVGLLEDTCGGDKWLESARAQIIRLDKLIKIW